MAEKKPTPRAKFGMKDIQTWWNDAASGKFHNPRIYGYDKDLSKFVRETGLPALEKNEYKKFEILNQWDEEDNLSRAEEIVKESPPATPTGTPTPAATPTPDALIRNLMGLAGSSGANYKQ